MCFELTAVRIGESAQSLQPVIICVSNECLTINELKLPEIQGKGITTPKKTFRGLRLLANNNVLYEL